MGDRACAGHGGPYTAGMRVKVGSLALAAANDYGIGLDDDGHLVEFMADWVDLDALDYTLGGREPVYLEVPDWAVIAIDERPHSPPTREGMAARARFIKAALLKQHR